MSPLMRAIAIAVLVLTPLVLVVLQRLEALREIRRKRREGKMDQPLQDPFTREVKTDPFLSTETICPQCHHSNPGDHRFCGYCGAELSDKGENEI